MSASQYFETGCTVLLPFPPIPNHTLSLHMHSDYYGTSHNFCTMSVSHSMGFISLLGSFSLQLAPKQTSISDRKGDSWKDFNHWSCQMWSWHTTSHKEVCSTFSSSVVMTGLLGNPPQIQKHIQRYNNIADTWTEFADRHPWTPQWNSQNRKGCLLLQTLAGKIGEGVIHSNILLN